ncbi:hypothetical protein L2K70_11250 [Nocardioides KLBMP 9356]|uniref:Uncharacterized protein n=1 Tax=Nocardioides potassii TaxID=2911371 RepID=A0ABS9HCP6_9ACTN|nr:hypothetical protein [Nocardioides potassii]MCF6378179.1 hypothetical protein [Nocardioides potassii]
MTQQLEAGRASPLATRSGNEPGWHRKAKQATDYLTPAAKLIKTLKDILPSLTVLTVLAGFGAFVIPGGLLCAGLVARATSNLGWDVCPNDAEDDPGEPAPEQPGEVTVAVDRRERLLLTGARRWMPRTEVRIRLVDPNGRRVRLNETARLFKTNGHGAIGKHRGRVLWTPPARHVRGMYLVVAKGKSPDGSTHREKVPVRIG